MIMRYKPDSDSDSGDSVLQVEQVDDSTGSTAARTKISARSFFKASADRLKTHTERLKTASGITEGIVAMPQAAPLIFPDIEFALNHEGPETLIEKLKAFNKILADYHDRRAQIRYSAADLESGPVVPEEN